MPLLATFEHCDQTCLLFPWADAHLVDLSKRTSAGPPLDKMSLMWAVQQLRGLTDGLRLFHTCVSQDTGKPMTHGGISGYHILGFRDPGRSDHATSATAFKLVLSGFGSTPSFQDEAEMFLATYQAPECYMEGYKISPSYDVWSLGCLMLEFIAWFLEGSSASGRFLNCRKKHSVLLHDFLTDEFYEIVRDPRVDCYEAAAVFVRVKVEVHDVSLSPFRLNIPGRYAYLQNETVCHKTSRRSRMLGYHSSPSRSRYEQNASC